MKNPIKTFLQYGAMTVCLTLTSISHADMNKVMALINNPATAPVIKRCEGNASCNAFVAISREWQVIPKDDPLRYFIYSADLNALIKEGKDFNNEQLSEIDTFAYQVFDYHAENANDRWLYVKGLSVLKYVQRTQFATQ